MKDLFEFLGTFGIVRAIEQTEKTGPILMHNITLRDTRLLIISPKVHDLFNRFQTEYPMPSFENKEWFFTIVLRDIFEATSSAMKATQQVVSN